MIAGILIVAGVIVLFVFSGRNRSPAVAVAQLKVVPAAAVARSEAARLAQFEAVRELIANAAIRRLAAEKLRQTRPEPGAATNDDAVEDLLRKHLKLEPYPSIGRIDIAVHGSLPVSALMANAFAEAAAEYHQWIVANRNPGPPPLKGPTPVREPAGNLPDPLRDMLERRRATLDYENRLSDCSVTVSARASTDR